MKEKELEERIARLEQRLKDAEGSLYTSHAKLKARELEARVSAAEGDRRVYADVLGSVGSSDMPWAAANQISIAVIPLVTPIRARALCFLSRDTIGARSVNYAVAIYRVLNPNQYARGGGQLDVVTPINSILNDGAISFKLEYGPALINRQATTTFQIANRWLFPKEIELDPSRAVYAVAWVADSVGYSFQGVATQPLGSFPGPTIGSIGAFPSVMDSHQGLYFFAGNVILNPSFLFMSTRALRWFAF